MTTSCTHPSPGLFTYHWQELSSGKEKFGGRSRLVNLQFLNYFAFYLITVFEFSFLRKCMWHQELYSNLLSMEKQVHAVLYQFREPLQNLSVFSVEGLSLYMHGTPHQEQRTTRKLESLLHLSHISIYLVVKIKSIWHLLKSFAFHTNIWQYVNFLARAVYCGSICVLIMGKSVMTRCWKVWFLI